ncbi:MAG: hypothetical protein GX306_11780 [Clostridiales bacterium]|jgi:hypothetical protein|nr:hypothetical protein [Clostridiales bacterium]
MRISWLEGNKVWEEFFSIPEGYETIDLFWATTFGLDTAIISDILLNIELSEEKIKFSDFNNTIHKNSILLDLLEIIEKGKHKKVRIHRENKAHIENQMEHQNVNEAYKKLCDRLEVDCCYRSKYKNGYFHPKVWLVKFSGNNTQTYKYRIMISSKNLTYSGPFNAGIIFESIFDGVNKEKTGVRLAKFVEWVENKAEGSNCESMVGIIKELNELEFIPICDDETDIKISDVEFHFQYEGNKTIKEQMLEDFSPIINKKDIYRKLTVYSSDISVNYSMEVPSFALPIEEWGLNEKYVCGNSLSFLRDFLGAGGIIDQGGKIDPNSIQLPKDARMIIATHLTDFTIPQRIHCKIYQMQYHSENKVNHKVWLGSANFTKAGLTKNVEAMVSFSYSSNSATDQLLYYFANNIYSMHEVVFSTEDIKYNEINELGRGVSVECSEVRKGQNGYQLKFQLKMMNHGELLNQYDFKLKLPYSDKFIENILFKDGEAEVEFLDVSEEELPIFNKVTLLIREKNALFCNYHPFTIEFYFPLEIISEPASDRLCKNLIRNFEFRLLDCIPRCSQRGVYSEKDSPRDRVAKLLAYPRKVGQGDTIYDSIIRRIDYVISSKKGLNGETKFKEQIEEMESFKNWIESLREESKILFVRKQP